MKRPSADDLELAADWLESNEGDESADLARVAIWLRAQVMRKMERDAARNAGIPVKALRTRLDAKRCKGCGAASEPGSPDYCSAECAEEALA